MSNMESHENIVNEEAPLIVKSSTSLRTYWYRWYILCLFGFFVSFQGAVWNTWGPLSSSMKFAFGWDNMTLSLMPFWGIVIYVLTFYPWTEFLHRYGLRVSCLLSAFFIMLGCCIKCIPSNGLVFKLLCHACAILNGFPGPIANSAITSLASFWFPRSQRVLATALGTACMTLGTAYSFLTPLLVPDVSDAVKNESIYNENATDVVALKQLIVDRVVILNWIEFGVALLTFLLFVIYFPSKPPTPPSLSCEVPRDKVSLRSFSELPLNTWLVMIAYGVPVGLSGAFSSVFSLNVVNFGINEMQAGWIGFVSTIVGTLFSFVFARIVDVFPNAKMSRIIIGLLTTAFLCYLWFTLMCQNILPTNTVSIYASNVIGNAALYSTSPLFYDLCCESAFPIAEVVSSAVITTLNNLVCGIFLVPFFFNIPETLWLNYAMAGSCAFSLPLLFLFKEKHHRRNIDLAKKEDSNVSSPDLL